MMYVHTHGHAITINLESAHLTNFIAVTVSLIIWFGSLFAVQRLSGAISYAGSDPAVDDFLASSINCQLRPILPAASGEVAPASRSTIA